MKHLQATLASHPQPQGLDPDLIIQAMPVILECAATCTACADACLAEKNVENLRRCIASDTACAQLCTGLGALLEQQTAADRELVVEVAQACASACRECAEECSQHAEMHAHCDACAQACRACETVCLKLAA